MSVKHDSVTPVGIFRNGCIENFHIALTLLEWLCCVKLVRPSFWLSAVFLTDLLLP